MNEIAAIIGIEQMKTIKSKLKKHMSNGKALDNQIRNDKVTILKKDLNIKSSYWVYSLLVDDKKKFQNYLLKNKIRSDELSFRNDRYSVFKGFQKDNLKNTNIYDKHMINIPCGWWLTKKN